MNNMKNFETLDPESWDDLRLLAHRMIDDAVNYIEKVGERPVWRPVPEKIRDKFKSPAPAEPSIRQSLSGPISGAICHRSRSGSPQLATVSEMSAGNRRT